MSEQGGKRVRVVLRWLQIKDKLEPWFKEKGEFQFRSRVTAGPESEIVHETKFPEEGHYAISDHPRFSKIDQLNKILYEGEAREPLVVELFGTELDQFSADDHLEDYKRVFTGPVESWLGRHQPGDEGSADPENLSNWRVGYDIELA